MKALIPQGLTGRPNCFGLLNNLMTLIICESLREIGEMACVTYAWSSRGQTLNLSSDDPACITLRYLCITYKYLKVLIFFYVPQVHTYIHTLLGFPKKKGFSKPITI